MSVGARLLAGCLAACAAALPAQAPEVSHVFGRVVDEQGDPVGGAVVEIIRNRDETLPLGMPHVMPDRFRVEKRVTTDARGRFAVEIAFEGHYGLRARKGDELASRTTWPLSAGQISELVALPTVEVKGRVLARQLDGSQSPVAGAQVVITAPPLPNLQPIVTGPYAHVTLEKRESDAEGRFRLLAPRGASLGVIVRHNRLATWMLCSPESEIEVTLPREKTVHGEVLDDRTGNPVPNARVSAYGIRYGLLPATDAVDTDADGRFTLTGNANLVLAVVATGHRPYTVTVQARDGNSPDEPLQIRLRVDGRVTARLVRTDGTPLANAPVVAHVPFDGRNYFLPVAEMSTDAQGVLSVGGASIADGVRAWVNLDGKWIALCHITSREDVDLGEIPVDAGHQVVGKVEDADGSPAAGIAIFAHPTGLEDVAAFMASRVTYTDVGGRFRLSDLPAATIQLTTFSPRSLAANVQVAPARNPEPIHIELQEALTLSGVVFSESGSPQAEVAVFASSESGPRLTCGIPVGTTTNAKGEFTLPCADDAGAYRLSAAWATGTRYLFARLNAESGSQGLELHLR